MRHGDSGRFARTRLAPARDGRTAAPLRIGDVATVTEGYAPPDRRCHHQRQERPAADRRKAADRQHAVAHAREVEAALQGLRPGLADVEIDPAIFRPATFIEQSLANLRSALGWGCGLVVLILFLFLRDLRSAAISLTAIPLSLLSAVLILSRLGGTLNTMFLAGLVIATGEVVDDAIIDVEIHSSPPAAARRIAIDLRHRPGCIDRSAQLGGLRQPAGLPGLPTGAGARRSRRRVLPTAGAGPMCFRSSPRCWSR